MYSQQIIASGGVMPHTFSATGNIPPGLGLSDGGLLAGTPTTPGIYCFTIFVRDSAGCSARPFDYIIVISAASCPAGTIISLSPPGLPASRTGVFYSEMITASGGTAPYTFAITAGSLPPNLTLNAATGLVSGTPVAGGNYTFTITATDANGCLGAMGCSTVIAVDIPAVSTWAMFLLSLVTAIIGINAIRKGGM